MVLSLILALFLPWQAAPPQMGSISGTVVDSVTGQALNKVQLALQPIGSGESVSSSMTMSDDHGRFAMAGIAAGRYRLRGARGGYLQMAYGARDSDGLGTVIELQDGQDLSNLAFKLVPEAVVAGTVRDSEGEPLEGANITLFRITYTLGGRTWDDYASATTDDRGQYRMTGLDPGKYYVAARPGRFFGGLVDRSAKAKPAAEESVTTYYPGVADAASSMPVAVSAGARLEGIDVAILKARVFRVAGRVTNAPAGARIGLSLLDANGEGSARLTTSVKNAAGDFEFRAVPAGSYTLRAQAETRDFEEPMSGRISVEVGDSGADDVRVALARPSTVKLRPVAEGEGTPDLSRLPLFFTANGRNEYGGNPFQADWLTVQLPAGHYTLRLQEKPRGYYLKSARAGATDVLADGLTVNGEGSLAVDVVLAPDGATVQGVALDKNQQPLAGATVLLAPDDRSRWDLFESVTADQNGHYEFAAIAPGDYHLFAWDGVETGAWNDPGFLKDYEEFGAKVSLAPRGQSTVDLAVAPPPDGR